MRADPLVTVVTPTTGNTCVLRAIKSVADQSYKNVQHLIVIDKPDAPAEIKSAIRQCDVDVIELPYATGKDRFLGHRIIGASAFLGRGISSVILTRTIGSTGTMSLHCSKSSGKGPPGPIHCGKLSTGMAISSVMTIAKV